MQKVFTVFKQKSSFRSNTQGTPIAFTGTLEELIKMFSYTLECGQSWEREKGNKKINCQPKSIKSLISNLNNAVNNSASNGYAGIHYYMETK